MEKTSMFITLEGIEGVGKSTHQPFIQSFFKAMGYSVLVTREPGGTDVAEAIRHILLTPHKEVIVQETELLLLFAGRIQHVTHVIKPALAEGKLVICDRYLDATYAYQGYGRGMPVERIAALQQWSGIDVEPDRVLLFDAPVEIALQRIKKRRQLDRFEKEREEFFQRIREGYLQRAKLMPERYSIIDANQSLFQVREQIKTILAELLKEI